jgi:hypothetical protein
VSDGTEVVITSVEVFGGLTVVGTLTDDVT